MNKYSTEFKAQALQLSDEIGTRKASQDLGISYHTLSGRRKSQNRYKDNCTGTVGKNGMTESERQRILEKENRELKETVRILQDALRFFVKGQKRSQRRLFLPTFVIAVRH